MGPAGRCQARAIRSGQEQAALLRHGDFSLCFQHFPLAIERLFGYSGRMDEPPTPAPGEHPPPPDGWGVHEMAGRHDDDRTLLDPHIDLGPGVVHVTGDEALLVSGPIVEDLPPAESVEALDAQWEDDQIFAGFEAPFIESLGTEIFDVITRRPGPGLAAGLAAIAGDVELAPVGHASQGIESLTRVQQVEVLAAARRLSSWSQAIEARTAGAMARESSAHGRGPRQHAGPDGDESTYRHTGGVLPRRGQLIDSTAEEVAMRLAISRGEARDLIRLGRAVTGPLSETGRALEGGEIDLSKARAITGALEDVPGPVAWAAEHDLLPHAPRLSATQLRRRAHQALVEIDPEEAERRHRRARNGRHVTHTATTADGMGRLTAVLPASDCALVDQTLSTIAASARSGGDTRTTDQLRADALVSLTAAGIVRGVTAEPAGTEGTDGEADITSATNKASEDADESAATSSASEVSVPDASALAPSSTAGGPAASLNPQLAELLAAHPVERLSVARPQIRVDVPFDLFAALEQSAEPVSAPTADAKQASGEAWPDAPNHAPEIVAAIDRPPTPAAHLAGYGAISADAAALLIASGTLRRILRDPLSGEPRDLGRSRYTPSAALADLVRLRDTSCSRPGCTIAAQYCQLDHVVPWAHGGPTDADNLQALCGRCHRLKSEGRVRVIGKDDGPGSGQLRARATWVTPTGHAYVGESDGSVRFLGVDRKQDAGAPGVARVTDSASPPDTSDPPY